MADIKSNQGKIHLEKIQKRNNERKAATAKREEIRSNPKTVKVISKPKN